MKEQKIKITLNILIRRLDIKWLTYILSLRKKYMEYFRFYESMKIVYRGLNVKLKSSVVHFLKKYLSKYYNFSLYNNTQY